MRIRSRHVRSRIDDIPRDVTCFVCLEGGKDLVHCGCACRGYAGYVHSSCMLPMLTQHCKTCHQLYSGEVRDVIYMENWRQSKSTPREIAATMVVAKMLRENDEVKQAGSLIDYCLSRADEICLRLTLLYEKAEVCIRLEKVKQAEQLSLQAVEGFRKLGRREVIHSLQVYSRALLKLGKTNESIDAICEAFEMSRRELGKDDESTLYLGLQSAAIVSMYSQDRPQILEARTRCEQQLAICQRVFGSQHTITKRAVVVCGEIRSAVAALESSGDGQGRGNMPSPPPPTS